MKRKRLWYLLVLWLLIAAVYPVLAAESTAVLETQIAAANAGDTIYIEGATYHGSLTIDKPLTIIGQDWPIIDGQGKGTIVKITAPNVTLKGFVIRNSGASLDQENSGIAVEAPAAVIEGNRLENTLFGVYLREAPQSIIRGNEIHSKDVDVPRRGDAIRVWYSNEVLIEDNLVTKGRDVVLWYSERLTVRNNTVRDGRYGLHFMYCDDATIENNLLYRNSVGAFMMYSRRIQIYNNTIASNRGPSGFGVGLKDMDDAIIRNNLFLDNRIGAHLDGSPREVDSIGRFEGNVFGYNDIGVNLLPSVRHNEFTRNSFIENEEQVAIAGGGMMADNAWSLAGAGNYWSDYAGYDADQNGLGDVVYRSDRLFENLMAETPALRIFLYSPATNAVDFAAEAFPLVRPQPKLIDEYPQMSPFVPADVPALPQEKQSAAVWGIVILLAVSLAIVGWPWLRLKHRIARPSIAMPVSISMETNS